MTGATLLQIYLFLQVFVLGAAAALAIRYSYAHKHPPKPDPETAVEPLVDQELPAATKARIVHNAETRFQSAMDSSVVHLQGELDSTTEQINKLLMRLAAETVSGEMERYRAELNRLHTEAETHMGGIRTEVEAHKAELKTRMEQELGAEKLRLIKQIDTKLADAVSSFLMEALQHNIDLGSQMDYLVSLLEEHKADFVKEVTDED